MSDSISTLALKVSTEQATAALHNFGGSLDTVKNKALQLGASLASLGLARGFIADAAQGQEALGKYEDVLGRFTKRADKLVGDLRASFNFDTATAQQSIATMVDLFTKAGVKMEDALSYTEDLQKRAADLEAFTNAAGGLEGVTQALTSGMLGNSAPLKNLGIVMNEDAVKAQLAEDKMKGLTFASQRAALAHARYAIILKQSQSAHGQVARESENYSNKLRKLRGVVADLRGELGDVLIPIATKVVDVTTQVAKAIEGTSPKTKTLIIGVGALTGAAISLTPILGKLLIDFKTMAATQALAASAAKRETLAAQAETAAEVANASASEATAAAKNIEATARARNAAAIAAENQALNSQTASSLATNATPTIAKSAKRVAATLGGRTATGALGATASKSLLGSVLSTVTKPLGKVNAVFVTLGRTLGGLVGKLPFLGRFTGLFVKLGGSFVPFVGWVTAAIGALQAFKKLPELIEVFFEEGLPKIKEFGAKIPEMIVSGAKSAWSGIGKIGTWAKDLAVDGLLGLGQSVMRLAGFETAASKQYKINKLIEDANAQHQKLLDIQQKQLAAQKDAYAAEAEQRRQELQTRAKYAMTKNDSQTQFATAQNALNETEGSQASLKRQIEQLQGEGNGGLVDLGRQQSLLTRQKESYDKEMKRRISGAASDEEYRALSAEKEKQDAAFDEQFAAIDAQREETVDRIKTLADELNGLNETWLQQKAEVDALTKTVQETTDAIEQDQRAYRKLGEENAKSLEADARQAALDNAKNVRDRLTALQAQADAANAGVQEAQKAVELANEKNAQINAINDRLNSTDVTRALADLSEIGKSGDQSDEAALKYASALTRLTGAGYDLDDSANDFADDSALRLLEEINRRREEERRSLTTLTQERDEASGIAGDLANRQANARAANRAVEDERKNWSDSQTRDREADANRRKDEQKRDRARAQMFSDELFARQLSAIERDVDPGDAWSRLDASGQKYDLIAQKGASDWSVAQMSLGETSKELSGLTAQINALRNKETTGVATNEEIEKRRELESRRDQLQAQYDSDADKALQSRWSTEKELLALEEEMNKEREQGIRDYVTQEGDALKKRLEEEAKAEEEAQRKRLQERSEVEKEQRQAVSGSRAIAAGTSEAFNLQSKIYDRGREELPAEKKIEKSTEQIEKYVAQMQEQWYQYLSGNNAITLSMGY